MGGGGEKEMCVFLKQKPYLPSPHVDACAEENSEVHVDAHLKPHPE